ncbi:unnamed protein product, partial [marine sediment metagenome]
MVFINLNKDTFYFFYVLAAESIPTRFIEITGDTVNIRTGPST